MMSDPGTNRPRLTVGSDWARIDRHGQPWAARVERVDADGVVHFVMMDATGLDADAFRLWQDEAEFLARWAPSEGPSVAELREAARLDAHAEAAFDPSETPEPGKAYVTALVETVVLLCGREPERAGLITRAAGLALRLTPVEGVARHAHLLRQALGHFAVPSAFEVACSAFPTAGEAVDRPTLPMPIPRPAPATRPVKTLGARR